MLSRKISTKHHFFPGWKHLVFQVFCLLQKVNDKTTKTFCRKFLTTKNSQPTCALYDDSVTKNGRIKISQYAHIHDTRDRNTDADPDLTFSELTKRCRYRGRSTNGRPCKQIYTSSPNPTYISRPG